MSRIAILVLALCAAVSPTLLAQTYPTKPIRVLVGFGAGGSTDLLVRVVSEGMGRQLGQTVIVENRTGANGVLAASAVKNAEPDGYTLYSGSVGTFTPVFLKDNAIVAAKELAPISGIAAVDWFIYVRPDIRVNSLKDLPAYTKANSAKLRMGTASTSNTMIMAAVARELGMPFSDNFDVIPYKATDQVIQALLNGDVHISVNAYAGGWAPHLASGKLRGLAVISDQRSGLLPAVPTGAEQGVSLSLASHNGTWAPLGTPRDVIARLNRAINEALRQPATLERIANLGMSPGGSTPEELLRRAEAELRFQMEFARGVLGIQPQ